MYYDELPEGMEEVDVVTREEYDGVVGERDGLRDQLYDSTQKLESARKDANDAKAKYASLVLNMGSDGQNNGDGEGNGKKGFTTDDLFRMEG